MLIVDWIIVGIVGLSTFLSIWRGFVREALSLVTWIGAVLVARLFGAEVARLLEGTITHPDLRLLAAFAMLFVATMIVGGLLSHLVGEFVRMTGLGGADRVFGMVFGLARGLLVVGVALYIVRLTPLAEDPWWQESRVIPWLETGEDWLRQRWSLPGEGGGSGEGGVASERPA